ncbi:MULTISPECIES: monooxygenase family protein [unclassified Serinicoccus]|uniref:monooxygenase family protein n=1 Tax=unclassified Serinicoccus TaxID=2643101 RepID=UPI003851F7B1
MNDAARYADAVFVGATRYTGVRAWARLAPRWLRLVRQMKRMPGYLGHQVYYRPPFVLGTLGFFATRDDLLRFARSGEHREVMDWVLQEGNATAGYIRLYHAGEQIR